MKTVRFNNVQSKNLGTGQTTDIPAIRGKDAQPYDDTEIRGEISGIKENLIATNAEVNRIKGTELTTENLFTKGGVRTESRLGITYEVKSDGSISLIGTATGSNTSYRWLKISEDEVKRSSASSDPALLKTNVPTWWDNSNISIPKGTTISWSICSNEGSLHILDVDGNVLAHGKQGTTTLDNDAFVCVIYLGSQSTGVTYDMHLYPIIIEGSRIPTYEDWEGGSSGFINPDFYTTPIDGSVGVEKLDGEVSNRINSKLPYQEGNIFFDVEVDRPMSFNGEISNSKENIHCVLRLPSTYTPYGKPTRLVLACHGASGFLKPSQGTWYNASWIEFIQYLNDNGYACFDSNIFKGEASATSGYAMGSPLYVNVLKKAYDYIVENYNVYPQIMVHGTSMGGVGASAFTHVYPQLVLCESSFAGRNFCQYLNSIKENNYTPTDNLYMAYGYSSAEELTNDKFSHADGCHEIFSLVKYENGQMVLPPSRTETYTEWIDYFAELFSYTQSVIPTNKWLGVRKVPYMSFDSWNDNPNATRCRLILSDAYKNGNSVPYVCNLVSGANHTELSYGQVADMRIKLVNWFKRWE